MNLITSFGGISVGDLSAAKEFYTKTLGLKLADDSMGLLLSLPNNAELFIYEKPDHVPATFTVLNLVVDNIDEAVDELQAKGVVFETYDLGNGAAQDEKKILRGQESNMGPDISWFKDPAGNILAILQDK